MTNELEKQFFQCFGIEPKIMNTAVGRGFYIEHNRVEEYPEITSDRLLKLICIVLNTFQTFEVYRIMNIDSLKEKILKLLILAQDDVYSQVQVLFKGNSNG